MLRSESVIGARKADNPEKPGCHLGLTLDR
jgi:hypothetical protein